MTPEAVRAIIERALGPSLLVRDRRYPTVLPPELAPWYCYPVDSGHSILVVLPQAASAYPSDDPAEQVVPAPVKAVLQAGWTVRPDGFIACDLPYDPDLGLVVPAEQEEYD